MTTNDLPHNALIEALIAETDAFIESIGAAGPNAYDAVQDLLDDIEYDTLLERTDRYNGFLNRMAAIISKDMEFDEFTSTTSMIAVLEQLLEDMDELEAVTNE